MSETWTRMLSATNGQNIQHYHLNQNKPCCKADDLDAMKDQLSDLWVEKDNLPATDDEVLLIADAIAFIHHNQDRG